MTEARIRFFLPALMGSLHQQLAEGELKLEQNDGTRRLYWADGELRYLSSDAVGEQFGNYLIRRGVLSMAALKDLLAEREGARVGDRVVQLGLMTEAECADHLQAFLGSVLLHAMEHPILKMTWTPGSLRERLSGDLHFSLSHRRLVWEVFQTAKLDHEVGAMFLADPTWAWQAKPNLLESLSDFPLNPTLAYALSLLGTEPLSSSTITALVGMPVDESVRLVSTLWAIGGLKLVEGDLPLLPKPPAPEPPPEPAPEPPPPQAAAPEPPIEIVPEPLEPWTPEEEAHADFPLVGATPQPPPRPFERLAPVRRGPTPVTLPPLPIDEEGMPAEERARRLLVKAKSYLLQERTSEAIRALEQSIKLGGERPDAYETWLMLGRLRMQNPAWSTRAVEALQVASRLDPRAAAPWALMGELYHRKGFMANAQGCFQRALELDPSVAIPPELRDVKPEPSEPPAAREDMLSRLRAFFGGKRGPDGEDDGA